MSIRDQIRSASYGAATPLDVPEWGVTVWVRSMSARARAELNALISDANDSSDRQLRLWRLLLVSCLVEEDQRTPVFAVDDIDWVFEHDITVIDRVASACLEASRVGKPGVDEAGKDSSDSVSD